MQKNGVQNVAQVATPEAEDVRARSIKRYVLQEIRRRAVACELRMTIEGVSESARKLTVAVSKLIFVAFLRVPRSHGGAAFVSNVGIFLDKNAAWIPLVTSTEQ